MRWVNWTGTMTVADWEPFRGKRIGVDILSLLYKARTEAHQLFRMLADIIGQVRALGAEPVFIFDGRSPREKDGTRSARRRHRSRVAAETDAEQPRISTGDRLEVKQFFYAMGVLAINAEQEADSVLAHLARTGELAAIVTSDMDFVPRGVEWVLLPDFQTPVAAWRAIRLSALLEKTKLTYPQFVDMCVLMGCDYAPYIPTISYQSAYWLIRSGKSMLDILGGEGVRTATAWERSATLLKGTEDTWENLVSERQREKWAAGAPAPEPDAAILQRGIGT